MGPSNVTPQARRWSWAAANLSLATSHATRRHRMGGWASLSPWSGPSRLAWKSAILLPPMPIMTGSGSERNTSLESQYFFVPSDGCVNVTYVHFDVIDSVYDVQHRRCFLGPDSPIDLTSTGHPSRSPGFDSTGISQMARIQTTHDACYRPSLPDSSVSVSDPARLVAVLAFRRPVSLCPRTRNPPFRRSPPKVHLFDRARSLRRKHAQRGKGGRWQGGALHARMARRLRRKPSRPPLTGRCERRLPSRSDEARRHIKGGAKRPTIGA